MDVFVDVHDIVNVRICIRMANVNARARMRRYVLCVCRCMCVSMFSVSQRAFGWLVLLNILASWLGWSEGLVVVGGGLVTVGWLAGGLAVSLVGRLAA